jgi:hypothetical protein
VYEVAPASADGLHEHLDRPVSSRARYLCPRTRGGCSIAPLVGGPVSFATGLVQLTVHRLAVERADAPRRVAYETFTATKRSRESSPRTWRIANWQLVRSKPFRRLHAALQRWRALVQGSIGGEVELAVAAACSSSSGAACALCSPVGRRSWRFARTPHDARPVVKRRTIPKTPTTLFVTVQP